MISLSLCLCDRRSSLYGRAGAACDQSKKPTARIDDNNCNVVVVVVPSAAESVDDGPFLQLTFFQELCILQQKLGDICMYIIPHNIISIHFECILQSNIPGQNGNQENAR